MNTSAVTVILASALIAGCANLPRDPENTLERVRKEHQVRIGVVENPPWVIRTAAEPAGAEVELMQQFARELGATPEWFWGSGEQHMQALKHFELELVVAGLDSESPWAKTIGLTRPYYEERILIGVPANTAPPVELKGVTVATKAGDAVAGYLRKKDASPLRVADISKAHGPVAAPEWQLEQLGFTRTTQEILTRKHVIAVPPGENGWLRSLEEFLRRQKGNVPSLLKKQEARP